jgi:formylglycine-generating enzyme required for sulfatase activity
MSNPLADAIDRPLSLAEVRAYLDHPVTGREREDVLSLVRWFRQRYPTPAERLAYARRAYRRWVTSARSARSPAGA